MQWIWISCYFWTRRTWGGKRVPVARFGSSFWDRLTPCSPQWEKQCPFEYPSHSLLGVPGQVEVKEAWPGFEHYKGTSCILGSLLYLAALWLSEEVILRGLWALCMWTSYNFLFIFCSLFNAFSCSCTVYLPFLHCFPEFFVMIKTKIKKKGTFYGPLTMSWKCKDSSLGPTLGWHIPGQEMEASMPSVISMSGRWKRPAQCCVQCRQKTWKGVAEHRWCQHQVHKQQKVAWEVMGQVAQSVPDSRDEQG